MKKIRRNFKNCKFSIKKVNFKLNINFIKVANLKIYFIKLDLKKK
jgi:hypothetical protein